MSQPRAAAANRPDRFLLVLIALLSVYVAAGLTPSSYAVALPVFGAAPHWISLGAPRAVRSDEWAVWTPYMQATVRNQFRRYNQTSPYHEDLRNMNPLPLMDWGLIFKPYFWPFMIVPPSYAFSFFFAFQVFSFIYGYRQLFLRLGISDELAAGGALLLFFCGYTQYWWTTAGPSLSFFPWIVLAAMLRHRWWKYVLFVYVVVAWIFGIAYPPIIIALGFVAILVCCAFRDEATWGTKELFLMAGALVCAIALVGIYYRDLLAVTMHTVYPGQRRSSSGTVSLRLLMGMFSPAFNQAGYRALGPLSICESGVVGSFLPVSVIAFIDYRAFRKLILGRMQLFSRRQAAIVGAGMLLMLAWIFVPAPVPFGKIFLWQFVPGPRMLFPVGVLVTLLCLWLLSACGVVLTVPRISAFFAIVLVSIFSSKYMWSLAWKNTPREEFLILPVFVAGTFLAWRRELTARQVVVYSCVLANIALFGFFNPILSAKDIFVARDTPTIRSLEKKQREDPRGWLVAPGFPGAVLNGQGFRSIQHVLLSPHLRFFREYFPEMPEAEFNNTFNRYAHVHLVAADKPYSPQPDVLGVPIARFGYTMEPAPTVATDIPVAGDWNGDGKRKIGIYRQGFWILDWDGDREFTPADRKFNLGGLAGDIPVVGHWTGAGSAEIGIYRGGTWLLDLAGNPAAPFLRRWGMPGDRPVVGDFDGDGKTDYAVWRPANGTWYIVPSSHPDTPIIKQWGLPNDVPVVADFDGDGKTDFAVWRPANGAWHIALSSTGATVMKQWGLPGDVPVAADFDGDGKADYAVWRPSGGNWYVLPSGGGAPFVRQCGLPGDIPVPMDYDGDGKTDIAVWQPSNGTWYIIPSAAPTRPLTIQWVPGDAPI